MLKNAICAEDKKLTELCDAYDPFSEAYESMVDIFDTGKFEYRKTLRSMFASSVSEDDKKEIMKAFCKNINDSTSFIKRFIDMGLDIYASSKDISRFVFNNTKSLDKDTKEALQKDVRKFGDQIKEMKKLFEEGKTIKLIPGATEYFKSNYESSDKFKPDTIKAAEKFDQCTQTFIDAFKKYLEDGEKSLFALYEYIYDKAAEATGLKGPSTSKIIINCVIIVVCVVAFLILVWLILKTMKQRNAVVETEMVESQEEDAQV